MNQLKLITHKENIEKIIECYNNSDFLTIERMFDELEERETKEKAIAAICAFLDIIEQIKRCQSRCFQNIDQKRTCICECEVNFVKVYFIDNLLGES